MNNNIIIIPFGDFGNKLANLMAVLDLQKKNNKKIKILYSYQYNDLLYDYGKTNFMDDLPKFKFKNINYEYFKQEINQESYILSDLLYQKKIDNVIKDYSNKENMKVYNYNLLKNKYPKIENGIIVNYDINGFKNDGASIIKDWLSDIKNFKIYNEFISNVGFDWYDKKYEYVCIYLRIGNILPLIYNETDIDNFILKPEFYDKALKILKSKTSKPIRIIFFNNLRLNSKLLIDYIRVFKNHGVIMNDLLSFKRFSQSYMLLIMSKVDHYIGSTKFIQLASFLYSKENSITIINSNFNNNIKYDYDDYPSNWIFVEDKNYRIMDNKDLSYYNLNLLVNLKNVDQKIEYDIDKLSFQLKKKNIINKYNNYYKNFDKYINSKFLRDLLLFKFLFLKNKIYKLNSNISMKEGLFIFNLIKKYKPKRLLEIGFACGISAAFILLSINKDSKLLSIDPFQKFQWDNFGNIVVREIIHENNLPKNIHKWMPLYSYKFFNEEKIKYDFCFIDGDHSYEGTLIDLNGCHKLLNNNGLLLVDDILHKEVKRALKDFFKKNNNFYKKIHSDIKTMAAYKKTN